MFVVIGLCVSLCVGQQSAATARRSAQEAQSGPATTTRPQATTTATRPAQPASAPAVRVEIDTRDAAESAAWAAKAQALVETWYPKVAALLASEDFTPPAAVQLVFKARMRGVAGTSGARITISARWIADHPDDTGMVIHEMTHIIQSYPSPEPGWVTEGIADYIRHYVYEPNAPLPPIDPAKASYRDGYNTTGMFFAWIERTYDKEIVQKLNAAMRKGKFDTGLFEKWTGKSLDTLWAEFVKNEGDLPARPRPG
jgi:hypothetical protein